MFNTRTIDTRQPSDAADDESDDVMKTMKWPSSAAGARSASLRPYAVGDGSKWTKEAPFQHHHAHHHPDIMIIDKLQT